MVDRDEGRLQLEYRGISDGQRKVEDPTTSYLMGGSTTTSSDMYSTTSAPGLSLFNNASANGFSSTYPACAAAALKNPIMRDSSSNMAPLTHAMLFRHAFATVDLASVENSRPKRRNARISKDPQSVAARHRRERISDRIRVLQRLVPGGTKMDTASMLDEAINYVKFLQAQVQTLETVSGATGGFDPRLGFGHNPLYRTSPLSYSSMSMSCATDSSSSQGLSAVPSDHHLGLLSPGPQSKTIYKSCGDDYRDQAILPLNGGL